MKRLNIELKAYVSQSCFKIKSFFHVLLCTFTFCTVKNRHVNLETVISFNNGIVETFQQNNLN